jgi:uncharacterized protein (UPF0276 family)
LRSGDLRLTVVPASAPNGVGLGLRWEFLEEVLEGPPLDIAFFEVSPENYMRRGGYYPAALERIRERYPIVTHGLTLSLGALEPPGKDYLRELATEVERLDTPWHSDHLAFTSAGAQSFHELLPLRFSHESLARVAERLDALADALGRPVAFENISYYAELGVPELSEADFINALAERTRAGLLLDVNNVYVNGLNHGFDPEAVIRALPLERVVEIHVAGHTRSSSGLVIDTHGEPVPDPVLALLEWTLERTGPVPVLLERDNQVPELSVLLAEVAAIRSIYARATSRFQRAQGELRATSSA